MKKAQMKLLEAEQAFKGTQYDGIVAKASQLYVAGRLSECLEKLRELPTQSQLLRRLIEKLRGKSVYKTLKRLRNGQDERGVLEAIAVTSLLTHVLLEIKAGHGEYRWLAISILEKATDRIYELEKD